MFLAGNGDGTFATAVSTNTGASPSALSAGDFNRDGKLDLAVAEYNSNRVEILLGNGTGSFTPAGAFAVNAGPDSLAIADLNQDGSIDLIVGNGGAGNLSVLMGNGDGTFKPAMTVGVGAPPSTSLALATTDFDGDGNVDVAVADGSLDTVVVLRGLGDGSFAAPQVFPAGGLAPTSIAAGDINGDGVIDLATTNLFSDTVSILFGRPGGGFQTPITVRLTPIGFGGAYRLVLVDFNGDGRGDLIVVNNNLSTAAIIFGAPPGQGVLSPAVRFPTAVGVGHPAAIAVADFNRDGRTDFVIANTDANNAGVLLSACIPFAVPTLSTFAVVLLCCALAAVALQSIR